MKKNLKVAIVHDFLSAQGGAEKVLRCICEMFPDAPIYTLYYDEKKAGDFFKKRDVRVSSLGKKHKLFRSFFNVFLPIYPETFDLRDFDLIISSSGAWSKGVVTKLNTMHISYIHSPMRFVWDYNEKYLKERGVGRGMGIFKKILLSYFRVWDRQAADRPERLIANSKYTRNRIKKYYRRDSNVVYPPAFLDVSRKNIELRKGEHFLVVSRLSEYKKVDIIVEAFNKIGLPLVVIGEGRQKKYLEKIALDNVRITGWQNEKELEDAYLRARCFVYAADEDFGMAAVEAMSYGIPVVAYKKGGLKEIVQEGKNGELFESQTVEVLADGIRRFIENEKNYSYSEIVDSVRSFSEANFKEGIRREITELYSKR